jgi:hypothetical protein
MAYGNMNPGCIFVRCLDGNTLKPVEGARAVLTYVQNDDAAGRLQLYDTQGNKTDTPWAESTSSGVAVLKFLWDPAFSTGAVNSVSDSPEVRISVIGPAGTYSGFFNPTRDNPSYFTQRVGNEHIFLCVNFGQAWSGGKGDFQFRTDVSLAMDALSKIKDIIEWSWKLEDAWIKGRNSGKLAPFLPGLGAFNYRPSTELTAFVGGFDVMMTRY